MITRTSWALCVLALAVMAMTGTACTTSVAPATAGGSAGASAEELAEYRLDGTYPDLDDDIAALTAAYNEALACIGQENISFTEQQNLDALKAAFDGTKDEFPAFAASARDTLERGSDDVCGLALGDDPDLDVTVALITDQRNRGRECRGDDPTIDDENTFAFLKQRYVQQMLAFAGLSEAATALLNDATQLADDECGQ